MFCISVLAFFVDENTVGANCAHEAADKRCQRRLPQEKS